MGLFDQINFNAAKSADSSYDLRLLDTPCDHNLRDEPVDYDITPLLTNTPFSGINTIHGVSAYSGGIDPLSSTTITTKYPFVNAGNFIMLQGVGSTVTSPIVEEFVVVDPISTQFNMMYPPKVNSTTAKEKIQLSNDEIVYRPFTRYDLFQLFGNIKFTDSDDIGKTIVFTYLSDKKIVFEKNKDNTINYKFEGLNQKSQGIFTVYGRALLSTRANLFIRYRTVLASCEKCAGSGQLNDLKFDSHGRLQLVYDFSKLIQDYFKRFYTEKGSNPFDLSEGTEIAKMIGIVKGDAQTLDSLIKTEIVNLLFAIRNKQKLQLQIQGVGLAEQIAQINRIDVRALNATDISIRIEVLSKSGRIEQIGSTVSLISGS